MTQNHKLSNIFDKKSIQLDLDPLASKILIVDDDPLNVDVLEEILKENDYADVQTTTDPFEAVELFRENDYDLILLDILMPGMDGFEVIEKFKEIEENLSTPILVLSALSDQKTRINALSNGARDYLIKPFNPAEVLVRIRNLIEVRLAQKQLRLHNEILDQKVQERTQELQDTRLEIINRLGMAAEYRDNETGFHIIRMSRICYEIAKAAGLSRNESELILHASPMHDIGKIGIPDSILLKPDKLSPDEWTIMKTHTIMGAKILKGHNSDLLHAAQTIATTHHEKWDGSGYPEGLSRQDIPLMGRITAIADVFDALTSKRPYKEAWPIEQAVAVIEQDSGIFFDPMLVRTFKARLPAIIEIKEKLGD